MENRQPKVSIGMPVWNGEDFIKLALDSLLAQEFKDFEIIISDNASTDNTQKICEEYVKKDGRIKYILQKENIGAQKNFNFVLDKATGEYFMWAAYDDLWEPSYISEMVKILDNNKSVIVAFCISDSINEKGDVMQIHYNHMRLYSPGTIFKRAFKFLIKNPSSHQANLIYGLMRTNVIRKIGGISNFKKKIRKDSLNRGTYAIDLLTIFRLMFEGNFYIVNKVLFHHRDMRKDTDACIKSRKKLDILAYIFSNILKVFFINVHGYYTSLRIIISERDIKGYQKYFLFCVAWIEEFNMFITDILHYFVSLFKFICSKDYRYNYYNRLFKYHTVKKSK